LSLAQAALRKPNEAEFASLVQGLHNAKMNGTGEHIVGQRLWGT
jgi:hypothetical protein